MHSRCDANPDVKAAGLNLPLLLLLLSRSRMPAAYRLTQPYRSWTITKKFSFFPPQDAKFLLGFLQHGSLKRDQRNASDTYFCVFRLVLKKFYLLEKLFELGHREALIIRD